MHQARGDERGAVSGGAELGRGARSVEADGLSEAVDDLLCFEVADEALGEGGELDESGVLQLDGDVVSDDFDVLFGVEEFGFF